MKEKTNFTLRMPKWLDSIVTENAAHYGISKNAYILGILQEEVE